MSDVLLGLHCELSVGGTVLEARDVTVNLEVDQIEVSSRRRQGWKGTAAGLRSIALDFEVMVYDDTTVCPRLAAAFVNGTKLNVSTSGGGIDVSFPALVSSYSESQPHDDGVVATCTLVLADDDQLPTVG